jgi:hypothetical protein
MEQKPTKHHYAELDDLEDLLNPKSFNPISKVEPTASSSSTSHKSSASPELRRASASSTRSRTASIHPSDTMRDYLNRIDLTQADEIDDAEAARRAGYDTSDQPETPTQELVRAHDVPEVIGQAMRTTGYQDPEWHTINHLPGYMQNAIRGMGRQFFSMFTSTDLEEIITIANVQGQGPTTDAELNAVMGWLRDNAEDLGEVEVSHGRAIPGYSPRVREYSTDGVRFHVVQDPMGKYIYAYPEQDAVTHRNTLRLGNGRPRITRNESKENNMAISLAEELRRTMLLLESIQDNDLVLNEQFDNEILEAFIAESTLSLKIGKMAGGQLLTRWIHRVHKLSNDAEYIEQPPTERVMWKQIKNDPDNFLIIVGERGLVGLRPNKVDIDRGYERAASKGREYDPANDNTIRYQIGVFTKQGEAKLRQPELAPGDLPDEPGVTKVRGGVPGKLDSRNLDNIFNRASEQIGAVKSILITRAAVEHEKIATRAGYKQPAESKSEYDLTRLIFKKISPVMKKLTNQALLKINNRAKRYIDAGNFEGATKVSQAGEGLRKFMATIDVSGEVQLTGNISQKFINALKLAARDHSVDWRNSAAFKDFLNSAATGQVDELKSVLDSFRDMLIGADQNPYA